MSIIFSWLVGAGIVFGAFMLFAMWKAEWDFSKAWKSVVGLLAAIVAIVGGWIMSGGGLPS